MLCTALRQSQRQRALPSYFLNAHLSILVNGEHRSGQLLPSASSSISAARQLGGDVTLLLAGYKMAELGQVAALQSGADHILIADAACLEHGLAEPHAALLATLQKKRNFSHILASSSSHSRNILPRAAALLDAQPVSDVVSIISEDTFIRPMYSGRVLETVQVPGNGVRLLMIRASSFAIGRQEQSAASIEQLAALEISVAQEAAGLSHWVSESIASTERPELSVARVVVAGGRALKDAAGFAMVQRIADCLGGAVGASRAAIDAGLAGKELLIGLSGTVVAPDLYVAVGISGAIHHLAGMKDSNCIVAINSDPEAPIFQVADYGLVGNFSDILPALEQELSKHA